MVSSTRILLTPVLLAAILHAAGFAKAPATEATAEVAPAAAPTHPLRDAAFGSVPVDSLSGARHHALEMPLLGFYAVFLPRDFDPSGRGKYALCVLLHGSGSTEVAHGASLAASIGLDGIIYIAPRAPYPSHEAFLEAGQAGWTAWPQFPEAWGPPEDSAFPSAELKADPIRHYADWIARCVLDARARYAIEGKAVVVGHSQGASFAQYFTAYHPGLVKAYAAYAGSYWRSLESDSAALTLKAEGIHPLILHSEGDSVVAAEESRKFVAYLTKHKVRHGEAFYPGGDHFFSDQVKEDVRAFVSKHCLGKAPPKRKGHLFVQALVRNSRADSAGLRAGDRIVAYDGKRIRSEKEFVQAVKAAESSAKPEVRLVVERARKTREAMVKPGRLGFWLTER